mmetsp:Transcript_19445/g.51710  ORF Transcript_19445/g.51710 Transcript_19445/m.51710 type:complete len:273 (+) Transcript_19445:555-1373(+)
MSKALLRTLLVSELHLQLSPIAPPKRTLGIQVDALTKIVPRQIIIPRLHLELPVLPQQPPRSPLHHIQRVRKQPPRLLLVLQLPLHARPRVQQRREGACVTEPRRRARPRGALRALGEQPTRVLVRELLLLEDRSGLPEVRAEGVESHATAVHHAGLDDFLLFQKELAPVGVEHGVAGPLLGGVVVHVQSVLPVVLLFFEPRPSLPKLDGALTVADLDALLVNVSRVAGIPLQLFQLPPAEPANGMCRFQCRRLAEALSGRADVPLLELEHP